MLEHSYSLMQLRTIKNNSRSKKRRVKRKTGCPYLKAFSILLRDLITIISQRLYLNTVANYSDQKINSKFLKQKLNREVLLCPKYFHQKRRNYTRRQRDLLTCTHGLYLARKASLMELRTASPASCLSLRLSQIKWLTRTFMNP